MPVDIRSHGSAAAGILAGVLGWAAALVAVPHLSVGLPVLAQTGTSRQAFPLPASENDPKPLTAPLPAAGSPSPGPTAPRLLSPSRPAAIGAPARQQGSPSALTPSTDPGRAFRYRLGPGDQLRMSVFMVEGYDAEVEVLSDGTINLPRLGSVLVWGQTIEEARQRITQGYDRYLRRPLVYLDLIAPRPVRVTLVGEVQKPGFYSLTQGTSSSNLQAAGATTGSTVIQNAGWPTLVDAVQRAGGITANADLSLIVLRRPGGVPGAQPVEFRFDYLRVLMEGGSTVNPLLYDGDMIQVSRAEGVQPNAVLIKSAASNFAPDTIGVTVVGEVISPGLKQVRSNSPLAAAVMAAGDVNPLRANSKDMRLLRLESDGTVSARTVVFDPAAPLDSPANPALHNGDVIVVPRNGWTKTNDFLAQAVAPIGPILNAASLFRILSGN